MWPIQDILLSLILGVAVLFISIQIIHVASHLSAFLIRKNVQSV